MACSDNSNNWIYAWNIGLNNNTAINYKKSNNTVQTDTTTTSLSSNSEYTISIDGNTLNLYQDGVLIATKSCYDTVGITRKIRIYNDASNVEYLKIKEL